MSQALILAGGKGTRLSGYLPNLPKPMLPVGGMPFLHHLIANLRRQGIEHVVLALGYKHESISQYFGDGRKFGVSIDYVVEDRSLGTGGAIRNAAIYLDEIFFVLNGDTFFDISILELEEFRLSSGATIAIALKFQQDSSRYGVLEMQGTRIVGFREKERSHYGLINGGVYACDREILGFIPDGECSFEIEVIPKIMNVNKAHGLEMNGYFIDIGIPESAKQAEDDFSRKYEK